MTWGAVNEWTTQAGYARLAAKAGHPVLTELLWRIMRQEGRHIDFYASEAGTPPRGDRRAQRLTRSPCARPGRRSGRGHARRPRSRFLARYLFDDDEGRGMVARIDRRIDRLPGLHGLGLLRSAAARYSRPDGTTHRGRRRRAACRRGVRIARLTIRT